MKEDQVERMKTKTMAITFIVCAIALIVCLAIVIPILTLKSSKSHIIPTPKKEVTTCVTEEAVPLTEEEKLALNPHPLILIPPGDLEGLCAHFKGLLVPSEIDFDTAVSHYDPELTMKPFVVAQSEMDALRREIWEKMTQLRAAILSEPVEAITRLETGINELIKKSTQWSNYTLSFESPYAITKIDTANFTRDGTGAFSAQGIKRRLMGAQDFLAHSTEAYHNALKTGTLDISSIHQLEMQILKAREDYTVYYFLDLSANLRAQDKKIKNLAQEAYAKKEQMSKKGDSKKITKKDGKKEDDEPDYISSVDLSSMDIFEIEKEISVLNRMIQSLSPVKRKFLSQTVLYEMFRSGYVILRDLERQVVTSLEIINPPKKGAVSSAKNESTKKKSQKSQKSQKDMKVDYAAVKTAVDNTILLKNDLDLYLHGIVADREMMLERQKELDRKLANEIRDHKMMDTVAQTPLMPFLGTDDFLGRSAIFLVNFFTQVNAGIVRHQECLSELLAIEFMTFYGFPEDKERLKNMRERLAEKEEEKIAELIKQEEKYVNEREIERERVEMEKLESEKIQEEKGKEIQEEGKEEEKVQEVSPTEEKSPEESQPISQNEQQLEQQLLSNPVNN